MKLLGSQHCQLSDLLQILLRSRHMEAVMICRHSPQGWRVYSNPLVPMHNWDQQTFPVVHPLPEELTSTAGSKQLLI
jgi:hypothetical protein